MILSGDRIMHLLLEPFTPLRAQLDLQLPVCTVHSHAKASSEFSDAHASPRRRGGS